MSELTDDQLDGLFRKSAEEFDPPFDPTAWQDMKSRLDTNDRTVPGKTPLWKNILRWGLVLGLFLFLLTGSLYTYRRVTKDNDSSSVVAVILPPLAAGPESNKTQPRPGRAVESRVLKNDSAQTTPDGTEAREAKPGPQSTSPKQSVNDLADTNGQPESRNPTKSSVETVNKVTPTTPNATGEEKIAYGLKLDRTDTDRATNVHDRGVPSKSVLARAARTKMARQRTGTLAMERLLNRKQTNVRRTDRAVTPVASNDPTLVSGASVGKPPFRRNREPVTGTSANTTENTNQPNGVQAEAAGLSVINELAIRPAKWPKNLPFTGRDWVEKPQPDTVAQRVNTASPVQRGLSIRFAVAPDLSSVGLKNFTRPGTNVGVYLEYRLASRWSVQAGIIQSTKIYSALGSEYTAPQGTWNNGGTIVKPLSIDGQCTMFDIPINIRYDFSLRPRTSGLPPSRWFVSGGVTSYYIKKEDYTFNYPPHTYNVKKEASYSTGGYGLSQLNLSVGYERALTKRLSWQVEPFIKMPLKGVGFFKIDLLSTGTFFSIRYKL
ncbi:hypothetical protein [Spirosoma sp.]|uniref:hypothetical protein n=1 Tax=Spirosoma sp. TaxID=1899569 RepID=UPI002620F2B9|nr:hypothetical protein [Spirosoma sp.]MCX6214093.1 hypothetical protein [Spirosoma sp.]